MIRYFLVALFLSLGSVMHAEILKMAVTTSFENSGLADVLLPEIQADLGIEVQLLVVGTGQALRLGEAGDVDAILVHSRGSNLMRRRFLKSPVQSPPFKKLNKLR
jgi:tungstate transport system substrate-binding protein